MREVISRGASLDELLAMGEQHDRDTERLPCLLLGAALDTAIPFAR